MIVFVVAAVVIVAAVVVVIAAVGDAIDVIVIVHQLTLVSLILDTICTFHPNLVWPCNFLICSHL